MLKNCGNALCDGPFPSGWLCNHVGFRPEDNGRRALMPAASRREILWDAVIFEGIRASDFIRYPLPSTEAAACVVRLAAPIQNTPFGPMVKADLNALTGEGGWLIYNGARRSRPFLIRSDVWLSLIHI